MSNHTYTKKIGRDSIVIVFSFPSRAGNHYDTRVINLNNREINLNTRVINLNTRKINLNTREINLNTCVTN